MKLKNEMKTRRGTVVSKSGEKSVKIRIDYKIKHPVYGKFIKRRTTLLVHDEQNAAGVGDVIDIVECRPISKNKNWRLVNVVSKGIID